MHSVFFCIYLQITRDTFDPEINLKNAYFIVDLFSFEISGKLMDLYSNTHAVDNR